MKTIQELRKAIKLLGFKVSTQSMSYGQHATYKTLDSKHSLTYSVFSQETLAIWSPLFAWRKEHREELKELREATGIYGLT